MNPTLFEAMSEINLAILLVAVNLAILVWFKRNLVANSAKRMMGMMTHANLDAVIAAEGDPQTRAVLKEARRRCRNCMREDLCDRWLAGKVGGSNTFCPNARVFRTLTGANGGTG